MTMEEKLVENGIDLMGLLHDLERRLISSALTISGDNRAHAAKRLGLQRTTLIAKMKKHGLFLPHARKRFRLAGE